MDKFKSKVRYKIVYHRSTLTGTNGGGTITHKLWLISHHTYVTEIVPLLEAIATIKRIKRRKRTRDQKAELIRLSKTIKSHGRYFTDKSPLYEAMETGILSTSVADITVSFKKLMTK